MLHTTILLTAGFAAGSAPQGPTFEAPVRLKAGDAYIQTEEPGYAAPCWQDIDGDGHKDLLVGQFASGYIHVFKGNEDGTFAPGSYLQAEGEAAEVPGVW